MKKYTLFLLFLIPSFAFASFDRNLYYGLQKDSQVQELQEFLTDQNVYSGPITGNFFSLTLSAVKKFQTLNGISPISGYFGPLTREKANSLISEVTDEVGEIINPAITPPKTTDDVVAKLNEQIALLLKQVEELQKQQTKLSEQQTTLGAIQQQQTTQTQQIQQQTEVLQQIQQNTAPTPYVPPPIPEIKRELKIVDFTINDYAGEIYVEYLIDNSQQSNVQMIFKGDDGFTATSTINNACGRYNGKCAYFNYRPTDKLSEKKNHTFILTVGDFSQEFNFSPNNF